jgi:hypothetical protein
MTGLSFKRKSVETPRHRTAWIEAGPEHGQMAAFKRGNINKEPTALLDAAKTMMKGPLVAEPIVPHA